MSEKLLSLCHAHVSYGHGQAQRTVLQDVNFTLYKGRHCAIMGANGAGKSTLLKLLRGEIWADGAAENVHASPITWYVQGAAETSPIMGKSITALVSAAGQERYMRHEWRLSGEDILLTAFSDGELLFFIPEQKQKDAVRAMAQQLNCSHLLQQEACTLSQGQLRMLMLGRALLRSPQILLLDEYLEGLDRTSRELISKALEKCDATLIFTGHRPHMLPSFIKEHYLLHDGTLTAQVPQERAPEPAHEPAPKLAHEALVPTQPSKAIHMHVENATVFIDRKPLLHDITWTWHLGQHWFLHGVNGSGKSTFLRLLASDEYAAWGGTMHRYCLKNPSTPELLQDRASIAQRVRLISDKEQMTYGYDVSGLQLILSGLDLVQGQYRHYNQQEEAKALALLQEVDLSKLATARIRHLSTGQLRRLLLARAFMGQPQMLLLDEPFSGLDMLSYGHMRRMLEHMSTHVGLLLVSHYEEDSLSCINCEAIMENGQLRVLRQDA